MILGLTGKYCSGKNHLSSLLEKRGFHIIDVDKLGHAALKTEKDKILRRFGPSVLNSLGEIDRSKLGAIVFSDPAELKALEEIIHPRMVEDTRRDAEKFSGTGAVINAAILFKMGLHRFCDMVIWVEAPLLERFFRAVKRDGWNIKRIVKRIWAQRKLTSQLLNYSVDIYRVRNSSWTGNPERALDEIFSGQKRPL